METNILKPGRHVLGQHPSGANGAPVVTRFAPSPTGLLHLGHVRAAWVAWQAAHRGLGGKFWLRIEDIDTTRCRLEFESALAEDLAWLGLSWETPRRQSEHLADYAAALEQLRALGVLYPCFCTRAEIQREFATMHGAPQGPEGPLYPGTCRHLSRTERDERLAAGQALAWRLDVALAAALAGPLRWTDERHGTFSAQPELLGDVVLARKDIATSYHLAVVVDDALQGITLVTRGEDLLLSTHLHRLLQHLLGLPQPVWHHHGLVCDETGRRLAKRHDALSLRALREQGLTPEELISRAMEG
jgi:glutamyl-Q tRNA(Asp) synthetase